MIPAVIISLVCIGLYIINSVLGIVRYDNYYPKLSVLGIASPVLGIGLMIGVILSKVLTLPISSAAFLFYICYSLAIFTIPGMLLPWIYKNSKPNPNKQENNIIKYCALGGIIATLITYILIGLFV